MTAVTHRASSAPSAAVAFPVSSSSSSTSYTRTSVRRTAAPEDGAATDGGVVMPYSLMQGSMVPVKRMLEALRLPWTMAPPQNEEASSRRRRTGCCA
ncbi:Os10g0387201 [Oryza sativa Japonica Group]|uniref:Os10g0387201 protein n=1 Tax=Oryza sativa subsp. japonica TaxID=39947 RepID=A0A0N7KRQ1_ORYSJ|nr:hypothetical protein EE612_051111 [Oryza sativa]BAT10642.1 Os10g0387201 [Oryza sativa Japonica Group]